MARKYDKEYRKFIVSVNIWIRKTQERMAMLPEIQKLSELTYEQWRDMFKEEHQMKNLPSPPAPPPPRLLREDGKPPKPPKND